MQVEYGCCEQSIAWFFIYSNQEVFGICQEHFFSAAHRHDVEHVFNIDSRMKYNPKLLFGEEIDSV